MVSHVSGKSAHLPILSNVLLKTDGGALKLSATNLEMAVNCSVRGKVEAEGEYSVPVKLFTDYVSLLPSGKVELLLKDDGIEIRAGDQETILRGVGSSEFPLLPRLVKAGGYSFAAADIKRAIGQVAFAVSTSETRPELSGVACLFGGAVGAGKVAFASTDSYRLAERTMGCSGNTTEGKAIVPARAFLEIARILGAYKDELEMPEQVEFFFTENQIVMVYGHVELVSRLIEGSFPDYQQIIPKIFKTEAVLSRVELQKAVRAASLFSRQGLFDVHFSFDPENGTCTIQSADQTTGKTRSVLKGRVTGETNEVTLNYRYFGEGVSMINSDRIRIKQIDAMNPVLLAPEEGPELYQYIIMPIRQ